MRLQKYFLSLGMVGALAFSLQEIIGITFWREYDPVTMYVSNLSADGAPHFYLIRIFAYIYSICFIFFMVVLCVKAFKDYRILVRTGFILMLFSNILSLFSFKPFPLTLNYNASMQNLIHIIITVIILLTPILSIFLLAAGYLKQEKIKKLGRLSLIFAVLFLIFNLIHLIAILNGINILGLMQRLSIYTLNLYNLSLSWAYVFKDTKYSVLSYN